MGPNKGNSVAALRANGVIGLGMFQHDCGSACTPGSGTIPAVYYDCPTSGCNPTSVSLAQQVPNPVTLFSPDNNGVMIFLPSVPTGGSGTISGSLIFGIGTQSNNALQTATVYTVPDSGPNAGDITTTFNGVGYPASFFDSGSSGIFFLDSATTGIPTCVGPNSPVLLPNHYRPIFCRRPTRAQTEVKGSSTSASRMPTRSSVRAISPSAHWADRGQVSFDWGLSFFYGRVVFFAIENMNTPGGPGPYVAY